MRSSFIKTATFCLTLIASDSARAAVVAPALVPKRTFTKAIVEIATPTGDPATAGSVDNQFTYSNGSGGGGVVTIPVNATVTPNSLATSVGSTIKWTFFAIPAGSVLTWDHPWPGEPTAGQGATAVATLTGYPTNNSDFGLRTIKMQVIQGTKIVTTKSANIQLFFKWDDIATGRTAPNWFYYWLQAIGGRANTDYGGTGTGEFGVTPGQRNWSYTTAQNKTKIIIYNPAQTSDPGDACAHGGKATTGIDTFEDTVVHENHHTVQIANADPVVGIIPSTPWRFGWSWNQGSAHNHWTKGADGKPGVSGTDDDANGTVDDLIVTGPGELGHGDDVNLTDPGDTVRQNWPSAFGPLPPLCWAGGSPIEAAAYNAEPDDEDRRKSVDWSDTGKQHY